MTALWRGVSGLYARPRDKSRVLKNELLSVQRLRGVAVLMVLAFHVEDVARKLPGWADFHSLFSRCIGYSAPDLFFVISGFIMTYITFGMPFEPRRWLINRFIRIYPMAMFFIGLVVVLWLYNPAMTMGSGEHDWGSVLRSLLILPQPGLPLLFVGWTLEHELVFYSLVFVVARFLSPPWLTTVLLTLTLLAFAKWLLRHYTGVDFWDYHLLSLYIAQFTLGACLYRYWVGRPSDGWKRPLALGALCLLVGAVFAESGSINREWPLRVLAFGFGYGFVLLALLNRERHLRAQGRMPLTRDWLVQAGDASYSLYLSHPFVLAVCGKVFPYLDVSPLAGGLAIGLAAVLAIAVGLATHRWLEKPVIELGKRLSTARPG
ncbi:MAG: acyltransferase [Pseudomonas sp.]|uniref:acyltransferase family protein n=1 Tax=Pseudomonas sp. TaxID=306 RepID=UPI003395A6A2